MRNQLLTVLLLLVLLPMGVSAQEYYSMDAGGNLSQRNKNKGDSTKVEFPRGLKVWTVDEKFGDITPAEPDTLSFMYMNSIFTEGLHGEFNTTGNLGAIRQNRIFTERIDYDDFIFNHGYDYFSTEAGKFHFTNTYSPITNVGLNSCGDRTNGEDHFKALFAVNAGRRLGVGFKVDYLYGRGYYQENSASLLNASVYGSYLGDRYQAHFLFSNNHQKQAESPTTTTSLTPPATTTSSLQPKYPPCSQATGTGVTTSTSSTLIATALDSTARCP